MEAGEAGAPGEQRPVRPGRRQPVTKARIDPGGGIDLAYPRTILDQSSWAAHSSGTMSVSRSCAQYQCPVIDLNARMISIESEQVKLPWPDMRN